MKYIFRIIVAFSVLSIHLPAWSQQIKIGNYKFHDGSEYQGELVKGKPNGMGTTTFPNGDTHTGLYV